MASSAHALPPTPSISWPQNRPAQRQPWTPLTTADGRHANGYANISTLPDLLHPRSAPAPPADVHTSLLPNGAKSLSGVSLRAGLLGLGLGLSLSFTVVLIYLRSPLWRAPFFLATLSLFHFLEYYITATYNPSAANISAFLLSQNGSAYNVAHTLAFLECILTHTVFWEWHILPSFVHLPLLFAGFIMLILGQTTRSMAMAMAGSNFNHTVQMHKRDGHELVTEGIYGLLRHPSYFGFWWWGLGTQMILGNGVCFAGYTVVLWRFFRDRIDSKLYGTLIWIIC